MRHIVDGEDRNVEKILTVVIPCYNSAKYMHKAIESAVKGGTDVEVIIIDDGSTDDTAMRGCELADKYPAIVKFVQQPNGGHGDAVMRGVIEASGTYLYVLDSDDTLRTEPLKEVIAKLRSAAKEGTLYDLAVVNYIYDKIGDKPYVVKYNNVFEKDRLVTWEDSKPFKLGQYITMHSAIFRTELLRECGLTLPKHTFYVDNLFVYYPLPYTEKIIYFDANLYDYLIGRPGQSVSEEKLMQQVEQQVAITKRMLEMHELDDVSCPELRKYMSQYLVIMSTICSAIYSKINTPDALQRKKEFWAFVKKEHPGQYKYMKKQFLVKGVRGNSKFTAWITRVGYLIARDLYHFN